MTDLITTSALLNPSDGFTRQQLREILALDFICSRTSGAFLEQTAEAVLENKWENEVGWECPIPAWFSSRIGPIKEGIETRVFFNFPQIHYVADQTVRLPEVDVSNLFVSCRFLILKPQNTDTSKVSIRFVECPDGFYRVNDFWCDNANLLADDGPTRGEPERIAAFFDRLHQSLLAASRDELVSSEPWLQETDSGAIHSTREQLSVRSSPSPLIRNESLK